MSRHQVYLEQLKAGLVKDSLDVAAKKIDKAIREVMRNLEGGLLSGLSRKKFNALLADLKDAQVPILHELTNQTISELMDLAGVESLFEQKLIFDIAKEAKRRVRPRRLSKAKAYEKALAKPIAATGDLLEPFLKDLTALQVSRVEKEVRKSLSMGRTIDETVSAIRGTKRNNYRDGALGRNWRDARTTVRTAVQHVSQTSREATWEANSDLIEKYQIVATLDGRTSEICRSMDLEIFVVGKGPVPPFHPGCRTTTVPYFEPSIWDEGETRSSVDGYVPAKMSYYEWLKTQDVEFQDSVLGPGKGKIFRQDGMTASKFSDLQLDRNFQPITLKELVEKVN